MRRKASDNTERDGIRQVERTIEKEFGWIFREQHVADFGIDAHAEVVDTDERVSGRLLGIQIKSGESYFSRPSTDGWTFRSSSEHLAYWLGHSLAVVVVLVHPDGDAYWQVIAPSTVHEADKSFTVDVRRDHRFDSSAREPLLALTGRGVVLLETMAQHLAVLPADAVRALRRADATDHLGATRLAERLATGRATPEMSASALIAAKPTWLSNSPVAGDLWAAVAAYASQHEHNLAAANAFELSAECGGPRAARALAFAGLSLLYIDRSKAKSLLEQASADGAAMLADIGLSGIDVPDGDARPFDVPDSMSSATDEELDAEPSVLNFLAQMAIRTGDLPAAVAYLERAVRSGGPDDTTMHLLLAEAIWRRAMAEGGGSPRDRREALGYAHAALEDRRRWDGPSAKALQTIVDIHVTSGHIPDALLAALPTSRGGTARDFESSSPEVAEKGAAAALMLQDTDSIEFFESQLSEGPELQVLVVMRQEVAGLDHAERVRLWTQLLDDVSDDAARARCVARLAHLGVWSPVADNMRSRSVLPADYYDTLHAVHLVCSGKPDEGLARLRKLSETSAPAANELVSLTEQFIDLDSAIDVAETQAQRWQDPAITVELIRLLRKAGGGSRAAELIERVSTSEAYPLDVRNRLCLYYMSVKEADNDLPKAVAAATAALAVDSSPDVAWALIRLHYNAGHIGPARAALTRYRPTPTSQDEVRLWLILHIGIPFTRDDAALLIDIVRRQPQGELRSQMVGLLAREIVLTPAMPPFPPHIVKDAAELSRELATGPGSGLRRIDDTDESLRIALEHEGLDPAAFETLLAEVRSGRMSVSDIATAAERPYGATLLQRPAGVLISGDLEPGLREAGESAARQATRSGRCVVDLSSLYLLVLMDENDRRRLRAALPQLVVHLRTVRDVVVSRDAMRGLAIASFVASLQPDGSIERVTLTTGQQAMLKERAEALEDEIGSCDAVDLGGNSAPSESSIDLAAAENLSLWCDDTALRQRARARGISTFGTLDLISVLAPDDTSIDPSAVYRRLLEEYVVDLPLSSTDLAEVAAKTSWAPGPVHAAISRRAWWTHWSNSWKDAWVDIATLAISESSEALVNITKAALVGAVGSVTLGRSTQRYQEIAALAIVGCHLAGESAPTNLLDCLAENAASSALPPKPHFVFSAVVGELEDRGVSDPIDVATDLLPNALTA